MTNLTRYRVVLELDIAAGAEDEEAGIRLGPDHWVWDYKLGLGPDERVASVEVYKQRVWERIK